MRAIGLPCVRRCVATRRLYFCLSIVRVAALRS